MKFLFEDELSDEAIELVYELAGKAVKEFRWPSDFRAEKQPRGCRAKLDGGLVFAPIALADCVDQIWSVNQTRAESLKIHESHIQKAAMQLFPDFSVIEDQREQEANHRNLALA